MGQKDELIILLAMAVRMEGSGEVVGSLVVGGIRLI